MVGAFLSVKGDSSPVPLACLTQAFDKLRKKSITHCPVKGVREVSLRGQTAEFCTRCSTLHAAPEIVQRLLPAAGITTFQTGLQPLKAFKAGRAPLFFWCA